MDVGSSVVKRRLSKQQIAILKFMYSYRFVTTKQVQKLLGKDQIQQAQQRLNTLLQKQYIGRRYSNDDKLLGRYASYFLLPAGLELLKGYGDNKALRLMRKDPTASQRFITHCIAVGDIAAAFEHAYRSVYSKIFFMSKTEMLKMGYDMNDGSDDYEFDTDYFPKPLPDALVDGWPEDPDCLVGSFFVEVLHSSVPFWVYRKRIQYLISYIDDDIWKDHFLSDGPPFLLVCDSPTLQRRVQRYLRRIYDDVPDEYSFLVTNRELLEKASSDSAIWTKVDDEKTETICLGDIPDSWAKGR